MSFLGLNWSSSTASKAPLGSLVSSPAGMIAGGGWSEPISISYTAPAPLVQPVTPTFDPKIEANALYGKPMALFVGGFARIGASPAPIVGPYLNAGTVDFIVSFGVPANVSGDRKIYAIYLDNELAWSAPSGGTVPADGTFAAESFDFIFKPGTLTQTICSLETTHFPGDENAYRPQMILQITGLPYARFMANTGKPVPYVACDIGDVTDGADPADGINLGDAWERVAYSPWAGYTSATAESVDITDVVDAGLFKDNFTVIDVGRNTSRSYRNIDVVVSDKVRIKDRGAAVTPDFIFTQDNIVADSLQIVRAGATGQRRELELLAIDPDQDYTIVPSLSKQPRDPVVVSASVGKETITLPWVIDASTRQALVTYSQQYDLNSIKKVAFRALASAYEVEPADLIALTGLDDIDNEIFKVTQTSHNGNYEIEIEAEAILRCSIFVDDEADPYYSNTILLVTGAGVDGSATIPDESFQLQGNGAVTGNTQIDTAEFVFGTGSIFFDGSGDAVDWNGVGVANDFQFGAGLFTIELWIRPQSVTGVRFLACQWATVGSLSWRLYLSGSTLAWNVSENGSTDLGDMSGGTVTTNVWQHVAVDYDGITYRLYLDGVVVDTFATPRTLFASTADPALGSNSSNNSFFYQGHMHARITDNVARYAGAFTPPTSFPTE